MAVWIRFQPVWPELPDSLCHLPSRTCPTFPSASLFTRASAMEAPIRSAEAGAAWVAAKRGAAGSSG